MPIMFQSTIPGRIPDRSIAAWEAVEIIAFMFCRTALNLSRKAEADKGSKFPLCKLKLFQSRSGQNAAKGPSCSHAAI